MSEPLNKPSALRLALRHIAHQRRSGDWRVLVAALVVAVAAVAAVGLITDRVRVALTQQGSHLLAADLRLNLRAPPQADQRRLISAAGVQSARVTVFPSVVTRGDALELVSVKAVERAYPLRGALIIRRANDSPQANRETVRHGPPSGRIWVQASLLSALDVSIGDTISLGKKSFTIGAILVFEPDRSTGFVNIAPRVMMAHKDLAATGLLTAGSRAQYHVLLAGEPAQIDAVAAALESTLEAGESLQTPAEARPALAAALDRADVFLDLAALVAVILAAVAIALAARQHALRRLDEIALIKTLGAPRNFVRRLLLWQLTILGLIGIALGLAAGFVAQAGLAWAVTALLDLELPGPSPVAAWPALATAAVLLAGFAWPALSQARFAPPARVFTRSADTGRWRALRVYLAAVAAIALLSAAATRDAKLAAYVFGAVMISAMLLAGLANLLLRGLTLLQRSWAQRLPAGLRMGLAAVVRRRGASVIQITAFGIGLTVLFLLIVVRGDLLASWEADVAANAPNRFLVNIAPKQSDAVQAFLKERGLAVPHLYPLVRARLVAVNGEAIADNPELAEAAGDLAQRALNLTWQRKLKADNTIIAGHWWQPDDYGKPRISIAASVAERLDVGVGDSLSFDVAGQRFTARITSIREINWSSLQANFFVSVAPGFLGDYPTTYITSLYLPPGRNRVLVDLVDRFPNISVINVAAIVDQVKRVVARVSLAVELVFGFTLAAGVMVLLAAIQASRDERRREAAVLRALGARSRRLRQSAATEFLIIGLTSALLAAIVAQVCAALLATQLLDLACQIRIPVWLMAIGIATVAIATVGMLSIRDVLRQPAWASLKHE